jgi:uncharacterized membrane protein
MSFLGFIVGLIVGTLFQSGVAAVLLAILGAFAFPKLFGAKAKSVNTKAAQAKDLWAPEASMAYSEYSRTSDSAGTSDSSVPNLQKRVTELEQRVVLLEQRLEQGAASARMDEAMVSPESRVKPPTSASYTQTTRSMEQISKASATAAVVLKRTEPGAETLPMEVAAVAKPQTAAAITEPVPKPAIRPQAAPTPGAAPVRRPPPPPPVPLRDRLPAPIVKLIYGGNMLVKLGVLILFLGLAFLLRYTAERVTVPIELRYAAVALVGAGLLGLGWFLRRKRADYALILQGAGIGVFYLTTLAAFKVHELLPASTGFSFLFGVAVLSAALAVLQNAPALAIVAALEGVVAPVLASTGDNRPVGLFTYLLILDLGIFAIAWFRAWRVLNLIGFVGTFTLAAGWAQHHYTDDQFGIVQPFLIVFFLLFTAVGLLFARRTLVDAPVQVSNSHATQAMETLRRVGRVDSSLVFGVPMVAFGMQYLLMRPWEYGAAFSAMALAAFYLMLGRAVYSTQPKGLRLLAEAYAIAGVIFGTLAIPIGLEGQWTGAAWAVEGAGMYWLGVRQRRPYARAFSFLVFAGAVFKLLQATQIDGAAGHALLQGSVIGPLLVAVSAFAMWFLYRRTKLDQRLNWESLPGAALPWLAMAALTLLLWQWFIPPWAAVGTALLASVTFAAALRLGLLPLRSVTFAMQALSVAGFVATLHRGSGSVALESGWQGALAASLIALSVLGSVAWSMLQARRAALARGVQPCWSQGNIIAVLTGVGLLHLAMLFQISLQQAALLWPITATLVLWVALRMAHGPLVALAGVLHLIAAGLHLLYSVFDNAAQSSFAHLGFWTPVALGLTALLAGDWIREEARPRVADATLRRWVNSWCAKPLALWLPVVWGLAWWLRAMLGESTDVLRRNELADLVPAACLAIVMGTSAIAWALARWREWTQLGRATLATLPGFGLVALYSVVAGSSLSYVYVPSSAFGWLVWPLAAVWHLRLLRGQKQWFGISELAPFHIAGFWLFLLLAARECQWQLGRIGDEWSSWQLLGWAIVPALSLWALRARALLQRWPLIEHRRAYLEVAALPVALYLFAWAWFTNAVSPGNAAPLPYLPLLNPLELANWLVLCALVLWWRALPQDAFARGSTMINKGIVGITGLAFLTGMVLRSCHHYAGVAWGVDTLYASWLTQAALSLTWAACGVVAMVFGHARRQRPLWIAGATLLGLVVLKLFFVELADRGGLFRIVSFMGVGTLLLLVGYFAPVPPANEGDALPESAVA